MTNNEVQIVCESREPICQGKHKVTPDLNSTMSSIGSVEKSMYLIMKTQKQKQRHKHRFLFKATIGTPLMLIQS